MHRRQVRAYTERNYATASRRLLGQDCPGMTGSIMERRTYDSEHGGFRSFPMLRTPSKIGSSVCPRFLWMRPARSPMFASSRHVTYCFILS